MFGYIAKDDTKRILLAILNLREELQYQIGELRDNLSVIKEQIADVERFWRVNDIDMNHSEAMKKLFDSWVDRNGNVRKRKKYIKTI